MQKISAAGLLIMVLILCSCSRAEPPVTAFGDTGTQKNILIVYLTRTSNTKAVAEIIHQQVGGDLIALELQNPYPENYQQTVAQVQRENETGYLPPLKTRIDSIEKYDVVFVGFPTWGMRLPPPMKTFLSNYDLRGKRVVPFNTNAGYGMGSSVETIKQLCPKSLLKDAFSTRGGIERDGILFVMQGDKKVQVKQEVKNWLQRIGF